MSGLAAALVIVAVVGGLAGILFASQATAGVALVAASCLVAIFARMAQASAHHQDLMRLSQEAVAEPAVRVQ